MKVHIPRSQISTCWVPDTLNSLQGTLDECDQDDERDKPGNVC